MLCGLRGRYEAGLIGHGDGGLVAVVVRVGILVQSTRDGGRADG